MTRKATPTAPSAEDITNWARGMAALAAIGRRKKISPENRSAYAKHAAEVRWGSRRAQPARPVFSVEETGSMDMPVPQLRVSLKPARRGPQKKA